MKICIINSILYTTVDNVIPRRNTIDDTMIYGLCSSFVALGHDVTLIAAEEYKPLGNKKLPFKTVYMKSYMSVFFKPHLLPLHLLLFKFLNKEPFDFIISSEFFSFNTLISSLVVKKKVIVWQELAAHNNYFRKIPSRLWYNIIGKIINPIIVPRSEASKEFTMSLSLNTVNEIIDHGIDINRFSYSKIKNDYFVVLARLVKTKRVDVIINKYYQYVRQFKDNVEDLYLIGDGDCYNELNKLVEDLGIKDRVHFLGYISHDKLIPVLSKAKAMLVYTEKDLNMVSIPEAIATGTPIITNRLPLSSKYIEKNKLGIVDDNWDAKSLCDIVKYNKVFVQNCINYRINLSIVEKAKSFIQIYESTINK